MAVSIKDAFWGFVQGARRHLEVLRTVGKATVTWQQAIGCTRISTDAGWALYSKGTNRTESAERDQSMCVLS
jgi:hypothetical protein